MEKNHKIFIVNAITSSRIIGTFLLPLMSAFNPVVTTAYISGLLLTDFIDGKLARKWEVSTLLGSVLDAFSDKVLGIILLLYLCSIYPIMAVPAVIESLIAINNINGILKGANIQSSKIGKIKTFILGITSGLAVLSTVFPSNILINVIPALTIGTSAIQSITLYKYSKEVKDYTKKHPESKLSLKELLTKLKKGKDLKETLLSPEYFKRTMDKSLKEKLLKIEEIESKKIDSNSETSSIKHPNSIFSIQGKNSLKIKYNLNDAEIQELEEYLTTQNLDEKYLIESLEAYLVESKNNNINQNTVEVTTKRKEKIVTNGTNK